MVSLRSGKRVSDVAEIDTKASGPQPKKAKTSSSKSAEPAAKSTQSKNAGYQKKKQTPAEKDNVLPPTTNLEKAINSVKLQNNTPTKDTMISGGPADETENQNSKAQDSAKKAKRPSTKSEHELLVADKKPEFKATEAETKPTITQKRDNTRPSTPQPACEVVDGVEKTPGRDGPIKEQKIGVGSGIKIAPFKGPKGQKVRKSFSEKEEEYGQEVLKRPDHNFYELNVCYEKGPKGSPTYDKSGFHLDYEKVVEWKRPKPYNKSAIMNGMDKAVDSAEKRRAAMAKIFFEPGAAPEDDIYHGSDDMYWRDRVSKDLDIPWHKVGVKEFQTWEKKGFRKAKKGEYSEANATQAERDRMTRLLSGASLRK
jgi:hypothetical protein